MAPGALEDSCNDLIARARGRWTEKSIVYTRRNQKKPQKISLENGASAADNPTSAVTTTTAVAAPQDSQEVAVTKNKDDFFVDGISENLAPEVVGSQTTELQNPEDDSLLPFSGGKDLPNSGEVAEAPVPVGDGSVGDSGLPHNGTVNADKDVVEPVPLVVSTVDDKIRFNLSKATSKSDIKELKRTLLGELDKVTVLFKQLESKENQIVPYNNTQISNNNLSNGSIYTSGHSHPQHIQSEVIDRRLLVRVNQEMGPQETRHGGLSRVNSDMGAARNMEPRPYSRQLSVSVMENNNRGNEYIEKEKRTPKANQFYRNSEFLLGKDRLPSESNKRPKTSNGRRRSGEMDHPFGFGVGLNKNMNHVFKNCSSLLQRLMKHKHGWVFNEPVNAKALGLVDYHDIIRHPMDLGTIKTRLSQNWYKSPMDFAEDVRLVFRNAMTYNPKGQDVHIMAEQLLDVFEERWAIIESEYKNSSWNQQMYLDGRWPPTPTSRIPPPQSQFGPSSVPPTPISLFSPVPGPQIRAFDRPESMVTSMAIDPKIHRPHPGRTPVPRKPKAKDPDKRDMTYDEKQRLSNNLQGLPPEKLDAIVQIIKRGNTTLSQHDDEIEVDIDSVNAETLWELDRFVTNYKKSLSKIKRKAELALQAGTVPNQNIAFTNSVPSIAGQIGSGAAFGKNNLPTAEGEKQGYNGSSSSSSSSDSGSSSSDSDSDSSSADGSDAGHSPKS